jgi:hypothetical protein
VVADYDARTAVEFELVLPLASLLSRLRRNISIETDPSQYPGGNHPQSGQQSPICGSSHVVERAIRVPVRARFSQTA